MADRHLAPAMMPGGSADDLPGQATNQALARGLNILRMLADERAPLTATEIGRRTGLHQSTASRVLATLTAIGYVRKNSEGRFEVDYGLLALASATTRLPLMTRPRQILQRVTAEHPPLIATMCMLWRDELIYLLRSADGTDAMSYWTGRYPINISSPGLRLVLDLPDDEARRVLTVGRERTGWGGLPGIVPATEDALLEQARGLLANDVLLLDGWHDPGQLSGAITVATPEPHAVALAIVGAHGHVSPEQLTLLLHATRREVEACFTTG